MKCHRDELQLLLGKEKLRKSTLKVILSFTSSVTSYASAVGQSNAALQPVEALIF